MAAPPDPRSNRFSNRMRNNARLSQDWPSINHETPCVWAVDNQLLLEEGLSPVADERTDAGETVAAFFADNEITPELVSSLFGESEPGIPDVHVVNVGDGQDVFALARELRRRFPDRQRGISPNHILVAAGPGDSCPYGPPQEVRPAAPLPQVDSVDITLLDSGYCSPDETWVVDDPLAALGYQGPPRQGSYPLGGDAWAEFPPDVPDAPPKDNMLDALAGHANFVAGIIKQRTNADLHIWNHNGSFVTNDLASITTEASVLHSLTESQREHPTQVIVVTYAFPVLDGVYSTGWDSALNKLRAIHEDGFVIVCPAGNQGNHFRRYPAALQLFDYPEVIGVGSLEPGGRRGSWFSNFGTPADPWVACAAIGEEVVSTFISIDMEPEDLPWPLGKPPGPHDFRNAWAEWQGTCFSAPKVAVAIGNLIANGIPAGNAFNVLVAAQQASRDPLFNRVFPNL